ncbi:pilus assembly protein TadG-related protein [Nocardioides gilvus]|uniref:pilus assembly protein TadG-related protein n=1 Tax=Nocardioides gilvus TaxID=1735589 RepID=UPI001EF673C7|nr:pilus assembly protein TadG-related protein [Nocardioides gilvus]
MALLIIGFALLLLLLVAVVVDASAAYLQRQGLTSIADGAALQGADLGSVSAYTEGLPQGRLGQSAAAVDDAVGEYLLTIGAYETYPGLSHEARVDPADGVVTVIVRAPLELPLTVPGVDDPVIVATGRAAVTVLR